MADTGIIELSPGPTEAPWLRSAWPHLGQFPEAPTFFFTVSSGAFQVCRTLNGSEGTLPVQGRQAEVWIISSPQSAGLSAPLPGLCILLFQGSSHPPQL